MYICNGRCLWDACHCVLHFLFLTDGRGNRNLSRLNENEIQLTEYEWNWVVCVGRWIKRRTKLVVCSRWNTRQNYSDNYLMNEVVLFYQLVMHFKEIMLFGWVMDAWTVNDLFVETVLALQVNVVKLAMVNLSTEYAHSISQSMALLWKWTSYFPSMEHNADYENAECIDSTHHSVHARPTLIMCYSFVSMARDHLLWNLISTSVKLKLTHNPNEFHTY